MPEQQQRETRGCSERPTVRAARPGDKNSIGTIVGYSAVFHSDSLDLGSFVERVDPHAFDRTLREGASVMGLVNHDPNQLIGRTPHTMRLSVDNVGLRYEIDVASTTAGRDALESVRRQDLRGSSFSFVVNGKGGEKWENRNGQQVRTLLDVDLFDSGPVSSPAYPATVAETTRSAQRRHMNGGTTSVPTPRLDAAKRRMELSEARYRSRAAAAPVRQRELSKAELIEQFTNPRTAWTDWDGLQLYKEQRKHVFRMNRFRRQRLEMQMRKAGLAR